MSVKAPLRHKESQNPVKTQERCRQQGDLTIASEICCLGLQLLNGPPAGGGAWNSGPRQLSLRPLGLSSASPGGGARLPLVSSQHPARPLCTVRFPKPWDGPCPFPKGPGAPEDQGDALAPLCFSPSRGACHAVIDAQCGLCTGLTPKVLF